MWKFSLILGFCYVTLSYCSDFETTSNKGIREFSKSRHVSTEFRSLVDTIHLNKAFRQNANERLDIDNDLLCSLCPIVVDVVLEERRNGLDGQYIVDLIVDICILLNIESDEVCRGAITVNADPVLYIADNRPEVTGNVVCATVLQDNDCTSDDILDLEITIPEKTISDVEKGQQTDTTPIKVLQVSDIHYDPMYLTGGIATCDEPLCCQSDKGFATNSNDAAGYWGDYRDCDTPKQVIDMAFDHISSEHTDIDYIFYTGDVISHRVWDTSISNNTANLHEIYETFYNAFPNTPIYPIFGNHEPHPLNGFAPSSVVDPSVSTNWLYEGMADLWGRWLPEDTKETMSVGGYYTVLLKPGFRVIALNSNVGYTMNWWILYDTDYITAQLQWLVDTLYEAEQNGEIVHILSHIPSGDGTAYVPYSRQFRRIITRFYNTITAIYNGHSHWDEWLLYHSSDEPTKPLVTAWNGGSLTSYSNVNFNYKIYTVDGGNYEILDFESWYYNITEANLTPEVVPTWHKMYSFKDVYGLDNLSPNSVRDLLVRMTQDHSLLQTHYSHRYRSADTRGSCDANCMRGDLCRMLVMVRGDRTQCDEFMNMWVW